MSHTSWRVVEPTVREWPLVRDLLVAADGRHQCVDLVRAVADSPRPAGAWRDRVLDLSGPGRFAVFARALDGATQGFVAAYVDGEHADRCVIVRHLVAVRDGESDPTEALLVAVEGWAAEQGAVDVLFEVAGDDSTLARVLEKRGYRPGRQSVDDLGDAEGAQQHVVEWERGVSMAALGAHRLRVAS